MSHAAPSFAPAHRHVEKAIGSYQPLFISALGVVAPCGITALSSSSSRAMAQAFFELAEAGGPRARRPGTVLGLFGQPADHSFFLVCRELDYLKFPRLQVG